jgi:hypothetical protein
MREIRKAYSNSTIGKKKTNESINKWKKKNKEKVKKTNRDYYQRNKDRILYNKKAREETECVLIFENDEKQVKKKINKDRRMCIVIDPKEK